MTTHGIILAAGTGTRLRPLTDRCPKALVPLADRPIIGHALDALAERGVGHVVVVGGHAIGALRAYLATRRAPRVTVVTNPAFATTNTLASLVCAAPAVDGDVVLLDGDLVFEPAVLARLDGPGTRLAVDRGRPLDDDAVKVATDGDRVLAVGKALPDGRRGEAESIGLARIDAAVAPALFATGRALLAAGATAAYYEAAFQRLIDDGVVLQAADVTSLKWEEIDDHADLRRAHSLFVAA